MYESVVNERTGSKLPPARKQTQENIIPGPTHLEPKISLINFAKICPSVSLQRTKIMVNGHSTHAIVAAGDGRSAARKGCYYAGGPA